MEKLITATLLFLIVVFFGCDSNPISQVTEKEIAEKQISTITITTNRGTETFEYEKLTYSENQLDITIFNVYGNQDIYYDKDSIIYYETF
jgi:hypothetical protein